MKRELKTFIEFIKSPLLEAKETYDSGCAMLYFEQNTNDEIIKLIDEADLYTENDGRDYGIEKDPHVTLLYGFEPKVKPSEVFDIIGKYDIGNVKAHNLSLFKSDKYDVLKYDIEGDHINECNEALTKLPYKNDYPEYRPHMTIAYLKKDVADKYIKSINEKFTEFEVNPLKFVYSHADGTKTYLKIKQKLNEEEKTIKYTDKIKWNADRKKLDVADEDSVMSKNSAGDICAMWYTSKEEGWIKTGMTSEFN